MNHRKRTSVSIGIAAYNEQNTIGQLLVSILKQKKHTFNLRKIIVVSDGSTDKTNAIVCGLAKQNHEIQLSYDSRRLGKSERLNQLYRMNTSDVFIQLDADIVLAHADVLESLLSGFYDRTVYLVGGNNLPVEDVGTVGHLINHWYTIWYSIRINVRKGDFIHNSHSCILALSKEFTEQLVLDRNITSDGQFIYCRCKELKKKFVYRDDARAYFRLPSKLNDYLVQLSRAPDERKQLSEHFGNWINALYAFPDSLKLRVLTSYLIRNPVLTLGSLLFMKITEIFPKNKSLKSEHGIWFPINSTKHIIRSSIK